MAERSGRELIEEWRGVLESLVSSAASAAGRAELPRELLAASQRQLELMQELFDRERRLQAELTARLLAPVDSVFDLLEETGSTLRRQAEALAAAGRALEETAEMMANQADMFERTIGALRQPTELARAAAGLERPAKRSRSRKRSS